MRVRKLIEWEFAGIGRLIPVFFSGFTGEAGGASGCTGRLTVMNEMRFMLSPKILTGLQENYTIFL
jgi:hypothetical protein